MAKKNPAGVRGCRIYGYRGGDIRGGYVGDSQLGEPWSSCDDSLNEAWIVNSDTIRFSTQE